MINIKKLKKEFIHKGQRRVILNNISLEISKGEICGIIGKSGAGKSTLLRCLNLLEKPTNGSITINKKEITSLDRNKLNITRHKIGMVFQHFNLLSSRTVKKNISFPLEILKKSKKYREQRVRELLEVVDLKEMGDYYPDQLSGGQKQRVAIARALASNPDILLSDEATSALDPETTKDILYLLKKINQDFNLTIVLITHEMDVIKQICNTVAILENGNIVEHGKVKDIFLHPKASASKKLINSTMQLELSDEYLKKLNQKAHGGNSFPVVKIIFLGKQANNPLTVNLYKYCNVTANIIQAQIEHVNGEPLGIKICSLKGLKEEWETALKYLASNNYEYEVLGYVSCDN